MCEEYLASYNINTFRGQVDFGGRNGEKICLVFDKSGISEDHSVHTSSSADTQYQVEQK